MVATSSYVGGGRRAAGGGPGGGGGGENGGGSVGGIPNPMAKSTGIHCGGQATPPREGWSASTC